MIYASFTNWPGSTKLPAHSVDGITGRVGKGRWAALRTRTIWLLRLRRAGASGLVDGWRVSLVGDPGHCWHFPARAPAGPLDSHDPSVQLSDGSRRLISTRAVRRRVQALVQTLK